MTYYYWVCDLGDNTIASGWEKSRKASIGTAASTLSKSPECFYEENGSQIVFSVTITAREFAEVEE